MTPMTRTQRGLLNVLDGCCILIVSATLILIVYRAVYGAAHPLTTVPLSVLCVAMIFWRASDMAGRASVHRKPLTQRWLSQRRARRASK